LRRLSPLAAFFLISLVLSAGATATLLWSFWGTGPVVWSRDMPWMAVIFGIFWLVVVVGGAIVGVPVLLLLNRVGLSRRLTSLLPAGLLAGLVAGFLYGMVTSINPENAVADPYFVGLFGGSGAIAGLLWWLLTCGEQPRPQQSE